MMKPAVLILCLVALVFSQIHEETIKPYSFSHKLKTVVKNINLEKVDHAQCEQEDQIEREDPNNKQPLRFGKAISVDINLQNSGSWETLADGSRIWRLELTTEGAFSTNIIFKKFKLPIGATLHVVSTTEEAYLGAFTALNNKEDLQMATGPLAGDSFILEYFEPKEVIGAGVIELESVVHAYRNFFGKGEKNGRSGLCNVNTICPEGNEWRDQIRGVLALMTSGGQRFCSASMINNHKSAKKQFVLTAAHCGIPSSSWVALFQYESWTCPRGGHRYLNYTAAGFRPIARNSVTDFTLAEIIEPIKASYNVYLNGFDGVDKPCPKSIGIHHPAGDVKKISFSDVAVKNGSWSGGPPNTHWRVEPWKIGTTEPGSSGSPLFNPERLIIGQLHGGSASCSNVRGFDVYGKVARSWEIGTTPQARLKDHLDPDNTGKRVLNCRGKR